MYCGERRDICDLRGRVAHESVLNTNDGSYRCPAAGQSVCSTLFSEPYLSTRPGDRGYCFTLSIIVPKGWDAIPTVQWFRIFGVVQQLAGETGDQRRRGFMGVAGVHALEAGMVVAIPGADVDRGEVTYV